MNSFMILQLMGVNYNATIPLRVCVHRIVHKHGKTHQLQRREQRKTREKKV